MAYSDIIKQGGKDSIWPILLAMEAQAALDCQVDTGNLRDSITIANNQKSEQVGPSPDKMQYRPFSDYEGAIGTACEYAAAKEFGRPDMPNYPADPYLRPALDFVRSKLGQITKEQFQKASKEYENRRPWRGNASREFVAGLNK